MNKVLIKQADFSQAGDCTALLALLDEYAQSPLGGGQGLSPEVRAMLPQRLAAMPTAVTGLAWRAEQPVGVINGFETLSTFKARPVLNVHDVAVTASAQGQGVGTALLRWVEELARARGCCKLTLEVLEGNTRARAVYARLGFVGYALDPQYGQALFWEKPLGE